jgi:uncharacterized protein YodC (DUF2158 family)
MTLIEVGDVVTLNSGGVAMTVVVVRDFGDDIKVATCEWFDTKGRVNRKDFVGKTIKYCEPEN